MAENGKMAEPDAVSTGAETTASPKGKKGLVGTVLAGVLLGVVLTALAVYALMPRMMIVTRESQLGFDATVEAIQKSIAKNGWSSPGTMNLNKAMAKHGVDFAPRVSVISLCNAKYAREVLTSDRHLSSLMPCAISVWEGDDGKVYVSKMNTGLMGKMFGGNVARVMGGAVAMEEHAILAGIVK